MTFIVSLVQALVVSAIATVGHVGVANIAGRGSPLDTYTLFIGVFIGALAILPWGGKGGFQ